MNKLLESIKYYILGLGILFSILLVLIYPEIHHPFDSFIFVRGMQYIQNGFQDVYLITECSNYPFLGMLGSTGVMNFFNGDIEKYQLFLGVVDGLNVLLYFLLFRLFNINLSPLWAGIIGILPSTWSGTAIWGQIDGICQFSILIALYFIFFHIIKNTVLYRKFFLGYIAAIGIFLSFIFLTKQVTIFSVFALIIITLIIIITNNGIKKWYSIGYQSIIVFLCFIFPIALIDSTLNLNEPYFSHIQHIFNTGSNHMDVISENGFNIWIFLDRNMLSSSEVPFLGSFTPKHTGMFFYLIFVVALSVLLFRPIILLGKKYRIDENYILHLVLFLALINLGFNIFFTGTHERYLYHFYPFVMIAIIGLRDASIWESMILKGSVVLGALVYGNFVWVILNKTLPYNHETVAFVHITMLLLLIIKFYSGCQKMIKQ